MTGFDVLLAALSTLLLLRLGLLLGAAVVELRRRRRQPWPLGDDGTLPLASVIVPAFNEERVLEGTVASLLAADHPALEIVLVDDGSTDETAALARSLAARHPTVRAVILARNGGKAAAINAGIAVANGEHIVTVDADTLLDPRALRRLCAPLDCADAVASNVKVGNRVGWLATWQSLEYVVGLNLHRRAQAALGCITTIPGAACAFRREALTAVGGFSSDTVVEDTDLTLALLAARRRVVFQPAAVAYTEAPDTIGGLFRQRVRWARGYLECIVKHRRLFLRNDILGWFGMPDLLFVNVLVYALVPLSLPGLVSLLQPIGWEAWVGAFVGLFALELALAVGAYLVDGEALREVTHVPLRQLVWPWFLLVVFLTVCARLVRGGPAGWGSPTRRGTLAAAGKAGKTGIVR